MSPPPPHLSLISRFVFDASGNVSPRTVLLKAEPTDRTSYETQLNIFKEENAPSSQSQECAREFWSLNVGQPHVEILSA